ncbi:hypothetical protein Tco_1550613 [Tanacetum coccineum]
MFKLYCHSLGIMPTRAIPDAMTWRHHDSDVYDTFPDNDFSTQDVQSLTEMVIDLRQVPSRLLFGAGLATTWEFPSYLPVFKYTKGNVVTMVRKKRVSEGAKDATTSSGHVSSSTPLQIVAPVSQVAQSQHEDEETRVANDEGHSASPRGSANEYVHHFYDIEENQGEENLPRIEPLVNLSGQPTHPPKEPVFATVDGMLKKVSPLGMLLFIFAVGTFLGGVAWTLPNGAWS